MPNIEKLMRKALEEGKFDDLPGKGKPLKMGESNPHADPEWELAYHVLSESGYSLPWIEALREIDTEIEAAREDFRRAWEWHQEAIANSQSSSLISGEWERAQKAFKEKLTALNKRIRDNNLQVPHMRFERPVLNIEREVGKITGKE